MNRILMITFAAVMILIPSYSLGQDREGIRHFDREAFEAKRNAFITAELSLTPEEASSFIPLCNELRKQKFELGRECRKLSKEIDHKQNPSEDDYKKALEACLDVRKREAELEREYYDKFKKILSPEKLYKYKKAEHRFVRQYMRAERRHLERQR